MTFAFVLNVVAIRFPPGCKQAKTVLTWLDARHSLVLYTENDDGRINFWHTVHCSGHCIDIGLVECDSVLRKIDDSWSSFCLRKRERGYLHHVSFRWGEKVSTQVETFHPNKNSFHSGEKVKKKENIVYGSPSIQERYWPQAAKCVFVTIILKYESETNAQTDFWICTSQLIKIAFFGLKMFGGIRNEPSPIVWTMCLLYSKCRFELSFVPRILHGCVYVCMVFYTLVCMCVFICRYSRSAHV